MKIIVTGFEPFLNNQINPTQEIVELLPPSIHGNEVIKVLLPVEFDKSFKLLKKHIEEIQPDVIINLGLATNRKGITPERIAINVDHSEQPDNIGVSPVHKPISVDGQTAYFTKLNLDHILQRLKSKNIPVSISNSAGTFVCNNLMYHVLEFIDHNDLNTVAGFVHVPMMDKQNKDKSNFSLPLDTMLEAVIDIIKTCIYQESEWVL